TAVIGGLISSQDTISNQGVPFISNIPVLGNLFSAKSTDKQKNNLLVFLTPHVVRNRTQLRALALDERQKYINSLGRKEMHNMPASQIHELYKPSFSISVPPEADLGGTAGPVPPSPDAPLETAPPPAAGVKSGTSGGPDTPFNTEEIGPTSMRSAPTAISGGTSVSSSAPFGSYVGSSTVPGVPVTTSGASAATAAPSGGTPLG